MRKMFYKTIPIVVAVMAILNFNSCSKDSECDIDAKNGNQLLKMPNQYKVIGEQHNEGLEFAFGSVRDYYQDATSRSTSATIEALSKEELLTLGKQAAMDFCVEINSDVPDDFYNKLINQPEETRSNSETPLINPDVKKYLERINALLTDDEPKSPERLIDGLNKINEDAALNLSEQDAIVVYAGTSTCFNS